MWDGKALVLAKDAGEIAEISAEPRGTILARLSRSRAELSLRMAEAGLATQAIPASMEDRS